MAPSVVGKRDSIACVIEARNDTDRAFRSHGPLFASVSSYYAAMLIQVFRSANSESDNTKAQPELLHPAAAGEILFGSITVDCMEWVNAFVSIFIYSLLSHYN